MRGHQREILALCGLALCSACSDDTVPVHRAVSATVAHYAPGFTVGGAVRQNAARLSSSRWVPHVGVVGTPPSGWFSKARLYPDAEARAALALDADAPVRALELIAENTSPTPQVLADLAIAFRGIPKQGCLTSLNGESRSRSVNYWVAPENGGGIAVIEEFSNGLGGANDEGFWSLFAWSGPFLGSETFLAPFDANLCDGTNEGSMPPSVQATVAAIEQIDDTFIDSVRSERAMVAEFEERERTNADAPNACSAPFTSSGTTRHSLAGVTLDLPADVALTTSTDISGSGYWMYEFKAADKTHVTIEPGPEGVAPHGVGGMLKSHCDLVVNGREVHIDVLNGSLSGPALRVRAQFHRFVVPGALSFEGAAPTQERQRELLRAAHSIAIDPTWGRPTRP